MANNVNIILLIHLPSVANRVALMVTFGRLLFYFSSKLEVTRSFVPAALLCCCSWHHPDQNPQSRFQIRNLHKNKGFININLTAGPMNYYGAQATATASSSASATAAAAIATSKGASSSSSNAAATAADSANMYRVGDYVYFENSSSASYAIRRIEELNKTSNGAVEARVICFYRRQELTASLLAQVCRRCFRNLLQCQRQALCAFHIVTSIPIPFFSYFFVRPTNTIGAIPYQVHRRTTTRVPDRTLTKKNLLR